MAKHTIPDTGSFHFFARTTDKAGNHTYKFRAVVGWVVDDENLDSQPVIFPPLEDNETLVYGTENGYKELG
jgi:hypothetical protein